MNDIDLEAVYPDYLYALYLQSLFAVIFMLFEELKNDIVIT